MGQYAGKRNGLAAFQIHLRCSSDADGTLPAKDRKGRGVPLSPKTNGEGMAAVHDHGLMIMVSDSRFVHLDRGEVRGAAMSGVVQRECRGPLVSVLDIAGNILEMKRKLHEARRWVLDVNCKEAQGQYTAQSADPKKMTDGIWLGGYTCLWFTVDLAVLLPLPCDGGHVSCTILVTHPAPQCLQPRFV